MEGTNLHLLFMVRPAWAQSSGLNSLVCPSSGKDIANGKGVASDCESEGSWMANLWSDERNHIRLQLRIRLPNKSKSNNYSELTVVNINDYKAWEFANTRKGYWRTANSPILKRSLNNKIIASLGFMSMTDYYLKICEN